MATHKYLSIRALNINGLNIPINQHRGVEEIRRHDPYICCVQKIHLRTKNSQRMKVNGLKNVFQVNRKEKSSSSNIHN